MKSPRPTHHRNGFALWYKRLEKGRFSFPPERAGKMTIEESAFQLLIGGLSLDRVWNHQQNQG